VKWKDLLCEKRVSEFSDRPSSDRHPGDLRTSFEQDYGRAVFSTPVRRLQDKAQVFPLEEHDAVRTRLTHSMEVSSVARGLALHAERIVRESDEWQDSYHGAIPTIAATCGLVHDLGNPPFGHAGEEAIGSWFAKQNHCFFNAFSDSEPNKSARETQFANDFLRFEGNAQTQRLLSRLQVLADENGLNMTCGTLSASCKYIAKSHTVDRKPAPGGQPQRQPYKKHGFFASENSLIEQIQQQTGTNENRNPIAFLVEAADDIVYATVDLEDGIKKKCFTWDFLKEALATQIKELNGDSTVLGDVIEEAEKNRQHELAAKTRRCWPAKALVPEIKQAGPVERWQLFK
jgi:dGTPase